MPNKNYVRGYLIERKARKELEAEGFYTFRSGGSKTCTDLIAIDFNVIRLIQVKSSKNLTTAYKTDENVKKLGNLDVPVNCRKELWTWFSEKKRWRKDTL